MTKLNIFPNVIESVLRYQFHNVYGGYKQGELLGWSFRTCHNDEHSEIYAGYAPCEILIGDIIVVDMHRYGEIVSVYRYPRRSSTFGDVLPKLIWGVDRWTNENVLDELFFEITEDLKDGFKLEYIP